MGVDAHTLAIEQSNPSSDGGCGVALVRVSGPLHAPPPVTEVLGTEPVRTDDPHQDDLMSAIDRLFARCSVSPGRLARVAVSIGPGGFTAVRVAVSTAKMICEATGAECVGVPSACVVARRANAERRPFAVALASKGQSAHCTCFDELGAATGPGRVIGAEDFTRLGCRLLIADRFLPDSIRAAAESMGVPIRSPVFDPIACVEAAHGIAPVDPSMLLPIYPREPEAVTKWRSLHRRDS